MTKKPKTKKEVRQNGLKIVTMSAEPKQTDEVSKLETKNMNVQIQEILKTERETGFLVIVAKQQEQHLYMPYSKSSLKPVVVFVCDHEHCC